MTNWFLFASLFAGPDYQIGKLGMLLGPFGTKEPKWSIFTSIIRAAIPTKLRRSMTMY